MQIVDNVEFSDLQTIVLYYYRVIQYSIVACLT